LSWGVDVDRLSPPEALAAARRRVVERVALHWRGHLIGSVAREHLAHLAAWPQWLAIGEGAVELHAPEPDRALAQINATLGARGLILGWRDELFAVHSLCDGAPLFTIERAAARFWGTLTLGAHCNGFVADAHGQPTQLWIARRALNKPTDPGLLDNLIGGGVPAGQTPREAVLREGFEEAGLRRAEMSALATGPVLRLHRDIAEGCQLEDLHTFDLNVPAHWQPQNQDGEVAGFERLPVADALRLALGGTMTVDAALVTLDFGARHGLLAQAGLDDTLAHAVAAGPAALQPGASDPFAAILDFSARSRQGA
jgi:8-oxo-dGTP pyrophosphatase MutT (NUDIX family)